MHTCSRFSVLYAQHLISLPTKCESLPHHNLMNTAALDTSMCCSTFQITASLCLTSDCQCCSAASSYTCYVQFADCTCALQSVDMAGHNTSLFVLGVMILWFGWYGFNPGSQLAIVTTSGSTYSIASAVANAATTTSLAPAAAGLTGLLVQALLLKLKTGKHHWDIMAMGNSTLAGLVAITAGCSTVYPWAAIVIGIVAGIIYPLASRLMVLIRVRPHHILIVTFALLVYVPHSW